MKIRSVDELRSLYPPAKDRAVRKQLDSLDEHCLRFVELSPFIVISTVAADGRLDASPRGGAPGFARVGGENTIRIPDASGNNRLDSLANIVETGRAGLLFFVPGVDETLRVNGRACLNAAPDLLQQMAGSGSRSRVVIEVAVEEAYLHCAKALMRSKLWEASSRRERSVIPTMGQMLNDQLGETGPPETQEEMTARYLKEL